jgi:hypothetical protein
MNENEQIKSLELAVATYSKLSADRLATIDELKAQLEDLRFRYHEALMAIRWMRSCGIGQARDFLNRPEVVNFINSYDKQPSVER